MFARTEPGDVGAEVLLRVSIDGRDLAPPFPLDGWRPQPAWRFGAFAQTGSTVGDHQWVRSLRVLGRHLPNLAAVALEITTNAQQFSTDAAQFTYYGGSTFQGIEATPHTASPRLMAVSVSSGPAAGATRVFITGVSLRGGDDYRCRFGGLITPAAYESDGAQPDGSACLGLGLL